MVICIIADVADSGFGGMKTYAENLVEGIQRIDKVNRYYVLNLTRSERIDNFEFIKIPMPRVVGKFFIRKLIQIPLKIRDLKPDVVLETSHFGPFFLGSKVKKVTVIHDLSTFIYPQHYTWVNVIAERLFLPRILKRADSLISVSKSTANDLNRIFDIPSDKVRVIPLGKEGLFKYSSDKDVLRVYKVRIPYFLHVGTIQPRKNLKFLVRAFDRLRDTIDKRFQLVLVGKIGWKSRDLIDQISRSKYRDDIILTGYIPKNHLPALYSFAEAFIFPSFYEGFGLPLLEAMSCGTPCISSEVSSIPEVSQGSVLYYRQNNVKSLTNRMIEVSSNPDIRNDLRSSALRVSDRHSWVSTCKASVEHLMSVAKGETPIND